MRKLNTVKLLRQFSTGLLLLTAACSTAVVAAPLDSSLSTALARDGEVRVIVGLNTSSASVTAGARSKLALKLTGNSVSGAKQAAIKLAHGELMKNLSTDTAKKARRFKHFPMVAMTVNASEMQALAAAPETLWIVEDRLHKPSLAESVPLVEGNLAQGQGFGGAGQAIAILDTGVDASHPFLSPRVVAEGCFSSNSSSTSSVCPNGQDSQTGPGAAAPCAPDGCSHGTHVAGISAGSASSSTGVAPEASVIAVQVFSQFNSTSACQPAAAPCISAFTSDIIAGLEFVLSQANTFNIAAVNMSLGGGSFTTFCDSEPTKVAIDALRAAGITTVVASGNEGQTNAISAPACISSAVSVGSTTKQDTVSSFSNSATFLTLLAPGSSIRSSVPNGNFSVFSGTSMAAPHVAGAIAAMRSANPNTSVDDLISALTATGLPLTDSRNQITKPRIRLAQAIAGQGNGSNTNLGVQPIQSITAGGEPGGPFSPESTVYTLTNNSAEPIEYSVITSEVWLSISPSSGTLAPNETAEVTVAISAAAATLIPGVYTTSVLFENNSGNDANTLRTATLTIQGAGSVNDKFNNAILLSTDSGSTLSSTVGAGKESGEPAHGGNLGGASIWWQWVASGNGTLVIDTNQSSFDTLLGVYTGAGVSALSSIAQNDDGGEGTRSRVEFNATVGTNYLIAVDGFRTGNAVATGNVALNWQFMEEGATTGQLAVSPSAGLLSAGSAGGPFSPATMVYTITNTSAAPVTFDVITNGIFFDIDTTAGQLDAGASTTLQATLNARAQALGPGTTVGSIIINGISRTVAVQVIADGSAQDNFDDRALISGNLPLEILSTNAETTKQLGEPNHAGDSGGASVWWSYTAPAAGTAVIETTGSNFDTLLAIYQGDALDQLSLVASNDDNSGLQSLVAFEVSANETYLIAVDGFAGAIGSITLGLAQLDGSATADNFADAQNVTGQLSLNNSITATSEPAEPSHAGVGNAKSIWWRWQANGGEQITMDTFGSSFDTVLAVYTGASLGTLLEIASNDDAGSLQSSVSFTATQGTTYFIAVDGFAGASGSVQLNVAGANIVERLVSSTLPTSRSVRVGDVASVFATLINNSPEPAMGCVVNTGVALPADFDYQQTNSATNAPIAGTQNLPMTLAPFGVQTLLLTFQPQQPIGFVDVPLLFTCDGTSPAQVIPGLNTVLLSAANNVVADVVALVATATNLGVVLAGPEMPGAFAVATANVGATEVITVSPVAQFTNPNISLNICETNPITGACLNPPAPSVTTNIAGTATPTFSVFVSSNTSIAFAPDQFRIQVVFTDPTGNVRGSTSVAVASALPGS